MVARPILRGDQKEKYVHGIGVKAFEWQPVACERESADKPIDRWVSRVRDGNSVTDAGGAELFSPHHRFDDVLEIVVPKVSGLSQGRDHFADYLLFNGTNGGLVARINTGRAGGQIGDDGVANEEVGQSHADVSSPRRMLSRVIGDPGSNGLATIVRGIPAMILKLFLVVLDLLLDALGCEVEGVMNIAVSVGSHELVFMLGMGDDLDQRLAFSLAVKVDCDHNGGQPVEVMQQLLGLLLKRFLGLICQEPVTG